MKPWFIPFAAMLLAAPAFIQAAPSGAAPSQTEAAARAKGVWIDVRSAEEFRQGHLQGARNVPVQELAAKIQSISPDKNAPVHLYCRSGSRAQAALNLLKQAGYTNVHNHGGYEALRQKGLK